MNFRVYLYLIVSWLIVLSSYGQTLYTNEVTIPVTQWTVVWSNMPTVYKTGYTEISMCSDFNQRNDTRILTNVPFPYTSCKIPIPTNPGTNWVLARFIYINGSSYTSSYGSADCEVPGMYLYYQSSSDSINWHWNLICISNIMSGNNFSKIGYHTTGYNPSNVTTTNVVSTNKISNSAPSLPSQLQ